MIRFYNTPSTYLEADLIDFNPTIELDYEFKESGYYYKPIKNYPSEYDRYFTNLTISINTSASFGFFSYFSTYGLDNITIEDTERNPLFLPHTSLEPTFKYICQVVNVEDLGYVDELYEKKYMSITLQLLTPTISPLSLETNDSYFQDFINRATPQILKFETGGVYFPTNNKTSVIKSTQTQTPRFRQATLTRDLIKPFDAEKIMLWCQKNRTTKLNTITIPAKVFGSGGLWDYFIDGFYYSRNPNNFYTVQLVVTQTPQ